MPLAPPGRRGYTDWQRVDNWDGDILYQREPSAMPNPEITDALDVSRFANIGGFDIVALGKANVEFDWYDDQALTTLVGVRKFVMQGSGALATAQYCLPNLGPWLKITWTPIGVPPEHTVRLLATNRQHPLEFIPQNAVLLDRQGMNLAPGASDTLFPSDYYSGPIDVWIQTPGPSWALEFDYLTSIGVWDSYDVRGLAAGNNSLIKTMPTGAWRVTVSNQSGAAGFYFLTIAPSTTGAT